jgi:hypothetical protein
MELSRLGIFIKEFLIMSGSAAQYNITINKNADFKRSFQIKESGSIVNITSYSFAGKLKENLRVADSDAVAFTASITDAGAGTFSIELTDTQTASMNPGDWRYDIVMTDTSSKKTRLLEGVADVREGVV